jgi:hypothetical protein
VLLKGLGVVGLEEGVAFGEGLPLALVLGTLVAGVVVLLYLLEERGLLGETLGNELVLLAALLPLQLLTHPLLLPLPHLTQQLRLPLLQRLLVLLLLLLLTFSPTLLLPLPMLLHHLCPLLLLPLLLPQKLLVLLHLPLVNLKCLKPRLTRLVLVILYLVNLRTDIQQFTLYLS